MPVQCSVRSEQASFDPLGERLGSLRVGVRHEHRKLVAANPGEGVRRAQVGCDPVGDPRQQLIAGEVSVRVVVSLEVVEIDDHQRDRHAVTSDPAKLSGGGRVESAPVQAAGQRVGDRRQVELAAAHLVVVRRPRADQRRPSESAEREDRAAERLPGDRRQRRVADDADRRSELHRPRSDTRRP